MDVENGRLILPYSEPIVLNGTIKEGMIHFNVFSKNVNVKEFLSITLIKSKIKEISGVLSDVDLNLSGPVYSPECLGSFLIEKLTRQDWELLSSPGKLNLKLKGISKNHKLYGSISLHDGMLLVRNTKIKVLPSSVFIRGTPGDTALNLAGHCVVDKIQINIIVQGTKENPEVRLSSDPPLPEPNLFLMLATGKSWTSTQESFNQKQISTDAVKDMIDFFVFGGDGQKFADQFSIKDFSLQFDKTTKGFGVRKSLTDKAKIGYKIEQTQTPEVQATNHKLEGAVNLSDSVSIDVEKNLQNTPATTTPADSPQKDDKILLKYKTKF